jgi:hypothetical protein
MTAEECPGRQVWSRSRPDGARPQPSPDRVRARVAGPLEMYQSTRGSLRANRRNMGAPSRLLHGTGAPGLIPRGLVGARRTYVMRCQTCGVAHKTVSACGRSSRSLAIPPALRGRARRRVLTADERVWHGTRRRGCSRSRPHRAGCPVPCGDSTGPQTPKRSGTPKAQARPPARGSRHVFGRPRPTPSIWLAISVGGEDGRHGGRSGPPSHPG